MVQLLLLILRNIFFVLCFIDIFVKTFIKMRTLRYFMACLCMALMSCHTTQKTVKDTAADPDFLLTLMQTQPEKFGKVLANPEKYELQIIYTQVDRDADNVPHFRLYGFRADSMAYFYPASTVKMATAFMALEKINQLRKTTPALTRSTPYSMDSVRAMQQAWRSDTSAINGLPSYCRKPENKSQ